MKRALVCTVSWGLVVVCGIAAQEVGSKDSAGGKAGPSASSAGVAAEQKYGPPAPINEYKGMQEREEVFEFAEKPKVTKEGDKLVITFASKGKCDATVTVVDPSAGSGHGKDGKIVRHLASGVLGKNAPWPFQQDSLSQKIEWDGLTDTFQKAPDGCKVKVSLGIQARFERNLLYDHYDMSIPKTDRDRNNERLGWADGPDGTRYLASIRGNSNVGRVYDKDGKYVRTFMPPSAADVEKVAATGVRKLASTKWGDKVLVGGDPSGLWQMGDFQATRGDGHIHAEALKKITDLTFKMGARKTPPDKMQEETRPSWLPPAKYDGFWGTEKLTHVAVDAGREEVYLAYGNPQRIDGTTGESCKVPNCPDLFEHATGPDGSLYTLAGRGAWLMHLDRDGKDIPFAKEYAPPLPDKDAGWFRMTKGITAVPTELPFRTAGCMKAGFCVSPAGMVAAMGEIPKEVFAKYNLKPIPSAASYVFMWNLDGKLLTANAVGSMMEAQGVTIDRDGSIYQAYTGLSDGAKVLDGLDPSATDASKTFQPGAIVKYRGLGGKFPLGVGPGQVKYKGKELPGSLWAYDGIVNQTGQGCSCAHTRFTMDGWARNWIPAHHLYSIVVIDSNGNRIARLGRYGNVDDTEADVKAGKDGVRICWPRAVVASDKALYVVDYGNRRILKAALSYAAEETVAVQ